MIFHYMFPTTKQTIRILDGNGEYWFVANDICEILEISNSRDAISRLDDDETGVSRVLTEGGEQDLNIISESGMYTMIIRSDKEVAKPFRRWVTHQVLPVIRKTGRYDKYGKREIEADVSVTLREKMSMYRLIFMITKELSRAKDECIKKALEDDLARLRGMLWSDAGLTQGTCQMAS